jgi:diguanylate cyclase (GGDEF)-like protein/PAS domain S-box-containing protein
MRDADGNVTGIVGISRDITDRKQAEASLRDSEERYRDVFDASPLPMWVWDDEKLVFLAVNEAAIRHYGYTREEFLGMSVRDIWAPGEQARYEESLRDRSHAQSMLLHRKHRTKGGHVIDVEVTARQFIQEGNNVWLTLINDITERKRAEERLLHLAHYDVLTSLPNRVLFYDRLKQALAQARRNQWITGVIFMDLDRFKNVNDTLGHAEGDKLLQQVSERLKQSVRAGDTVGRLGGDEFAIVLSDLSSAQDANLIAQKIMASFKDPIKLAGVELYVTASIGITLYPDDSTDQETLIRNADAAMYRAKEVGRNSYRFYTPEMNARALELLSMENSLRGALERDEFILYYQPKASVADGRIVGVEALLRWLHPERGLVSPGEFMPVLEDTGLIVPVGEWVLKAVCEQIRAWGRAGIKPVPVAVNLSPRQFASRDLGETVKRIIEECRVDPRLVEVEITESSLMTNLEETALILKYVGDLGVGLSIDDFGTGYSSLAYLKRFPLDALKVDRSFVKDLTTDADDATITRALISMAHNLGLKVVAEGVETEAQLAFLVEHGCDEIQGFYFSRPLIAEECGAWLREGRCLQHPPA